MGEDHITSVEEFVYERTVIADINKPKKMPGIFWGNQTFVASGIAITSSLRNIAWTGINPS